MIRTVHKPLVLLVAAACAAPLLAAQPAPNALPSDPRVTAGAVGVTQSGTRMDIRQATDRAIIEWQRFDIGSAAQVVFSQPGAASITLNRVLAGDASQIQGRLSANGQVYLVNPAGVVFGSGSRVNVGGLVASSLDIADGDFLAGRNVFTRNGATGKVINRGGITAADGGLVALLAPEARNEGVIRARFGNVALAGGNRITLASGANGHLQVAVDPATVDTLIENRHLIVADGGQAFMSTGAADRLYSAVVANSGTVQARTLENRDGRILLLADMDHGQVRLGGTLDASAPRGGTGGFVETSAARVNIGDDTRVVTRAASGRHGTWLIDPNDYTIAASGGDISAATLAANLAGGNVVITTAAQGTAGGNGNIFVNDAVAWSADTTLSLQAERDIRIGANLSATGDDAGLVLGYGSGRGYALDHGAKITLSGANPQLRIGVAGAEDAYMVINSLGVAGDTGTASLQGMRNNLGGKYALGSDIVAAATANWNAGAGFDPIGSAAAPFTGSFAGLGNAVVGLTINRPTTDDVGLFGVAAGTLRDVGLIGGSIAGRHNVGALAGSSLGAAISAIYSSAAVGGNDNVGGLIGDNRGSLARSYAAGAARGSGVVGGLVGTNAGSIADSYSAGPAIGDTAGGLVGTNAGTIDNSYSAGTVSGTTLAGGLVGRNSGGAVGNSYWNTETSGQPGSDGAAGLITAQMMQQSSYPGWDFAATWRMVDGQAIPGLRSLVRPLTITARDDGKIYDGAPYAGGNGVAYSATVPDALIFGTLGYGGSAQGAVSAGSYNIAPQGLASSQYELTLAGGTLSIQPRPLAIVSPTVPRTYDSGLDMNSSGNGGAIANPGYAVPTSSGLPGGGHLVIPSGSGGLISNYQGANAGNQISLTSPLSLTAAANTGTLRGTPTLASSQRGFPVERTTIPSIDIRSATAVQQAANGGALLRIQERQLAVARTRPTDAVPRPSALAGVASRTSPGASFALPHLEVRADFIAQPGDQ